MASRVRGAKELRAAIRRAPEHLRREAGVEVKAATGRMHSRALALLRSSATYAPFWHGGVGMQDITGAARRSYRKSVSRDGLTGRVGLLSAAAEANAFYLRFFLHGTAHQPARPFHDDAFEAEREPYIAAQRQALERVLRAMG